MATQWTGENVSLKIQEIYALPLEKRMETAAEIRKDVKAWAQCYFIFSTRQQKCMNLMSSDFFDEIGFQIARAIEKLTPLYIFVSDDTIPLDQAKKGGEVSFGWSQAEGFHLSGKFTF